MRIKEIQVNGLFGMFNHKIPLNLDEHITIIYGINGVGKTMLFNILDTLYNGYFDNLIKYPFSKVILSFNDDTSLIVEKKDDFILIISKNNLSSFVKYDSRIGNIEQPFVNSYKLFHEMLAKQKIRLIETQRLINLYYENSMGENTLIKLDTVTKYSNDLSITIQHKHKEYSKLSEELDLSLSKRLINNEIESFKNNEELKKEAKLLEDRRNELKSVGLLENIPYQKIEIPDNINDVARAILSVNIQDMKVKLDIFNDLYTKLRLFTEIINERRFSYKKLIIDHNKGFVFVNSNEEELTPLQLSSGEQHELVMLYELLFKVEDNTLVLIDEPEISLHISWQKEFLNDLREIIKIKNFDVIIATHSPAIIDDNWNLTVELEKTPQAK